MLIHKQTEVNFLLKAFKFVQQNRTLNMMKKLSLQKRIKITRNNLHIFFKNMHVEILNINSADAGGFAQQAIDAHFDALGILFLKHCSHLIK